MVCACRRRNRACVVAEQGSLDEQEGRQVEDRSERGRVLVVEHRDESRADPLGDGKLLIDSRPRFVDALQTLDEEGEPILSVLGVLVEAAGLQPVETLPELGLSGEQAPVDRASLDADRAERKEAPLVVNDTPSRTHVRMANGHGPTARRDAQRR
jgi:hypothetical protein